MSLKLYLTTDENMRAGGIYRCEVWASKPRKDKNGMWHCYWGMPASPLHRVRIEKRAAFGFPPPGEMRVIEVGEYEEGKDER